ncbi:MAG TPA: uridine diphosphate-N-acetylglucosamine-binding protein YvcK [Candidatus Dormibacteraeota bacterium]|nr:uridine diphosphate-N-acetylglucosamine-binding protein YvcK [Candidatus Dormibacteraeota bacterium]
MAPLRMNPRVVRWFTPGLHVKRWLVLLMVGMVLISLGIGYALRNLYSSGFVFPGITFYLTLQFLPRFVRAGLFAALGVGIILFALYKLTQSVLGPFLPGRDRALSEIIYNYRFLQKGPRVVALGGGTGLSTLLRGLKKYTGNLTAIVTVADDGGSSGRLRAEYRILPPGDFRQCITALADVEPLMTTLFQHRFKEGSLNGHSFGNLFIMAMAEITGDFEHAIRESGRVLAVRGQIVPSTLRDVTLIAEMADGQTRVGESSIPHANGDGDGTGAVATAIKRVFLEPESTINPEAEEAILNAEMIIVGPGSLYTSILPNLVVDGMAEALKASPAIKVFVCNVATQPGETDAFRVSDHLKAIESHLGTNIFDFAVVNSNNSFPMPPSAQAASIKRVVYDPATVNQRSIHAVLVDVVDPRISTHHDPDKLARAIMKKIWRS